MSLQSFFDNFAPITDVSKGVPKLRKLVLDLAVQGAFGTQNPTDQPAYVLLEKIIGNTKARSFLQPEGVPFSLPDKWLWMRFGDVFDIQGGTQPPKSQFAPCPSDGYVRLLQIRDFGNKPDPIYINRDSVKSFCTTTDVMLARYGASVGKVFMGQDGAYNVALTKIIFNHDCLFNRFVFYLLKSSLFQDWLRPMSRSAQAGFNKGNIHPIPLPLPPFEEQRRIVYKLDDMMRLCDDLEARHQQKRESSVRLNNATLAPLNNATSLAPVEFEQASMRLADNFDTLYDSAETVEQLRSTILQLAVQGKLVPHDPSDTFAIDAVEVVRAERKKTAKNKVRRQDDLGTMIEPKTFGNLLPTKWTKVRLGEVVNCLDFLRKPINKEERLLRKGSIPYYGANGQVGWIDDYLFEEELVLVVEDETFIGRKLPFSYKIMGKAWVNNHAHVLQPTSAIDVDFLNYSLAHYPFIELTSGTTGRKKLTKTTLLNVAFLLPPVKEQNRIVARVNQLMVLCDELESKLRQAEADSEKLMNSAVRHVLSSISGRSPDTLAGVSA